EAQIDARLTAMQAVLLHQIVAQLAEPESGVIVSEMRSGEHAQRYIGEAGGVAVAVLETEADHPANHKSMKVFVGEHRRHHDLVENIENIEQIRIDDQGQLDQLLDLPGAQ